MRSRALLLAGLLTTLAALPVASADGMECQGVTGVGEVCYDYTCFGDDCVIYNVHTHLLDNPTPGCTGAPGILQVCVEYTCYGDDCVITDVYVCVLKFCT